MDSYACGPEIGLTEKTTAAAGRDRRAVAERDALVVRHQRIRLTWQHLAEHAERIARGLVGLGLLAGAKSRIKALFLSAQDERTNYRAILKETGNAPDQVIYLGEESWARMLTNGCDLKSRVQSADEIANMQYTPGTAGTPKGVLLTLTHRNLVNNARISASGLRLTESDRICLPVPMYPCFGCSIGTMVALNTGACLVMPAPRFDALATMEAVQEERCTALYGVPTMFIAQLQHPAFSRFDFTSLRTGVIHASEDRGGPGDGLAGR